MRRGFFFVVLLMALAIASTAAAQVSEPNGLVVPRDPGNGEEELSTLFASRGESINWISDAHTTPATFSPLCSFTATFVLNQAGSHLGLAWYNATGSRPPNSDLHTLISAGAPVGTMVSSMSIRSDPAYLGGEIGFALVGSQTHYSEKMWNPMCSSCSPPGPWIMAVMYKSTTTPDAYYVAFEDGTVGSGPGDFSNDGDYNDDVFFVTGITCSGGGMPCDTGMKGVCAQGLTQCTSGGTPACSPVVSSSAETCNGLDDDCNGMVDDGDLCPSGFVCDHGSCVHACDAGEFGCDVGLTCNADGFCVDAACVSVTCPAGSVCHAGTCRAPCDGVTCPYPTVCRVDQCVDPCAGVMCPMGEICDNGVCNSSCVCAGCTGGTMCNGASGLCVDPACMSLSCPAGTHCVGGSCTDDCAGATCPPGQVCSAGSCVADACAGVTCPAGQTCSGGSCVAAADPCAAVSCPAGQMCSGGACVADPCAGVSCNADQHCVGGSCVAGAGGPDAGAGGRPIGTHGGLSGGGCCSVAAGAGEGPTQSGPAGALSLLLVAALLWRRRR